MKAAIVTLIAILSFPMSGYAQEKCACTQWPFKPDPPCFDVCVATVLASASPKELKSVLHLSPEVAKVVSERLAKDGKGSLSDLKEGLTADGYAKLMDKMKNLDQKRLHQFKAIGKPDKDDPLLNRELQDGGTDPDRPR